jgi:translation initiation factor 2A
MFRGGKPAQRYVPGNVPGAPQTGGTEDKKKLVRSKRPMKEKAETNGHENGDVAPVEEMATLEVAGEDEGTQKKLRNLTKKVSSAKRAAN